MSATCNYRLGNFFSPSQFEALFKALFFAPNQFENRFHFFSPVDPRELWRKLKHPVWLSSWTIRLWLIVVHDRFQQFFKIGSPRFTIVTSFDADRLGLKHCRGKKKTRDYNSIAANDSVLLKLSLVFATRRIPGLLYHEPILPSTKWN